MMKKLTAIILALLIILTSCTINTQSDEKLGKVEDSSEKKIDTQNNRESQEDDIKDPEIRFTTLDDPELFKFLNDDLYSNIVDKFGSEDYIIEDISTQYISDEYLEEISYNSKSNIYFGYSLEELDSQFNGERYIFTLGEDGRTVVEKFEGYDDTYERVIKNVAIGTGVILISVTVSVATAGLGTPVAPAAVNMIFATAAKTGTQLAISSGAISGIISGAIKGIQTGDFEEAKKVALLQGSESFKWGAITGAISGGFTKALELKISSMTKRHWRKSEIDVSERYKKKGFNVDDQAAYIDGKEVAYGTPGGTRPDFVINNGGLLEAVEVKNYNLELSSCRDNLYKELERQVKARVINLPKGSTQRIALDVRGRNFKDIVIKHTVNQIKDKLKHIYPDIPIDVIRF